MSVYPGDPPPNPQYAPQGYGPPAQGFGPPPQGYGPPAPMMQQQQSTNVVIVNQPTGQRDNGLVVGNINGHRDWTTGLFGCCEDCSGCCLTWYCPELVLGSIASRMHENCCVACCVPGGTILLRTRLRGIGGIRGSICEDYCAVSCCWLCSICQMDRELRAMAL